MTSIIIGDIINSRKLSTKKWLVPLKQFLANQGKSPKDWEIFRGDQFQLEVKNPEEALLIAIQIKALMKSIKLDARMSIGLGDKTHNAKKISESNGSAFINSGELFENLKKEKNTLAIKSGNAIFDYEINLMLRLALLTMDNWLPQSSEFVSVAIKNQSFSQEQIGEILNINQAAVSRRKSRSQLDLILEFDTFYREKIKNLSL
ncbi:SatD family protein [Flavobacterium qiangtangense]|uniref:SatD family protein n=1 Tax=Flavobacterium qiangtangense TaxID=1442595 RepID=A0ABW1PM46_9FLAO